MNYYDRLKFLNLYSLKGRRLRGDLIQTFKIFHGFDDVNLHTLFSEAPVSITRNSAGKLFVKHAKTNKRKFSFSFRVINHSNALPTHVKFAKTVNEFKNQFDEMPQLVKFFCDFDE